MGNMMNAAADLGVASCWIHRAKEEFESCRGISMSRNRICMENERLLIRSLEIQDLEGLKAIRNDPRVYRYEPTFLLELQGTPEEALKAIQSLDLYEDRQCILGVFEKTDPPVFVGLAELYDYKQSGKCISLGCRFLSEHWGRGIATSCVRALLEYIRNNTEIEMVTAHVMPANRASSQCVLKNGFEYLLTKTEDWGYAEPSTAEVYTFDC